MGGGQKIFLEKISSVKAIWGGVYTELLNFGGGLDGIGRKWGGSAFGARRAPNWYTPPPGMFMTPSLIETFEDLILSTGINVGCYQFSKGVIGKHIGKILITS